MSVAPPPLPAPLATVAGTPSSQAPVVQQQLAKRWAAAHGSEPFPLACWTAAPLQTLQTLPAGSVYWLPTPAQAPAAERALEQACRTQWMEHMDSASTLRVLYGSPAQQVETLWHCLQAPEQGAQPSTASDTVTPPTSSHAHAAGLRCRECVDPDSEQRLFSRLLSPPSSR